MIQVFSADRSAAVVKRCLHILALLQKKDDNRKWNDTTLAKILSADERVKVTPAAVKKYRSYIEKDLGLKFDLRQGSHRFRLRSQPGTQRVKYFAGLYLDLVVNDTSRKILLDSLADNHEDNLLWILGGLHLSCVRKTKVKIWYLKDDADIPTEYLLHPYHLLIRNLELYLLCRKDDWKNIKTFHKFGDVQTFIVHNIIDLELTDEKFNDPDVPALEEYYEHCFGSYTNWEDCPELTIKVKNNILRRFMRNFSNLGPKAVKINDSESKVIFRVRDVKSVCKQLFMYGKDVEVVKPDRVRKEIVKMLEESLGVYR